MLQRQLKAQRSGDDQQQQELQSQLKAQWSEDVEFYPRPGEAAGGEAAETAAAAEGVSEDVKFDPRPASR